MATTRFFLQSKKNPATVYISLSVKIGMVFKRKTGYFVNPDDWSEATNLPKQNDPDNKNLTTQLMKLGTYIVNKTNQLMTLGQEPTGEWLQEQLDSFHGKHQPTDDDRLTNYIQRYIENLAYKEFPNGKHGATKATLTKYTTLKSKIEKFEAYKKKTYYLRDVNPAFRNELVKYFREVDKLGANTTGRYVKFLKTVCLDARDNAGLEVSPQLKGVKGFTEKVSKIYLSFDELEKIENCPFTRDGLNNAKDWLIIGCYIGQRVSDLLRLTSDNIVNRSGLEMLELVQIKTGKAVSIPVHDKVKNIIAKRGGEFPKRISDQKFNKHIKDICKLAGLDQMVYGGKNDKETKRKVYGTFPKHELVTSHICRRSFASNFYGEMPTALIMSITAHGTEQQFLAYIGKTTNDYAVQIAEYFRTMALKAQKQTQMTVIKNAQ